MSLPTAPNSDEFVLVAGRSRPSAQEFDRKCTLIYDFGKQARNMASYSANGRFLVLVVRLCCCSWQVEYCGSSTRSPSHWLYCRALVA